MARRPHAPSPGAAQRPAAAHTTPGCGPRTGNGYKASNATRYSNRSSREATKRHEYNQSRGNGDREPGKHGSTRADPGATKPPGTLETTETMQNLRARIGHNALAAITAGTAGTFAQSVRELLQNARRSTTDRIDIQIHDQCIEITDYGHGVRNPAALLEYGTAVWTPRVLTEDPAGIGLFSLANEHVRIATRPAPTDTGEHHDAWSVDLTPAHFRGKPATPGTADNAPKPHGTTVSFCPDHIQDRWIDEQVMHFPVPVRVNGRKVARQPIAADADATIDWKGLRIGLFDGRNGVEKRSKLNCHGAVVSLHLRTIEGAPYAMVELVDCPQLRLERPGLGAVTDDQFTHELHEKVADLLSERKSAEERP